MVKLLDILAKKCVADALTQTCAEMYTCAHIPTHSPTHTHSGIMVGWWS